MQEVAELAGWVKLVLWGMSLGIAALAIYGIPPLQAAFQWIDAQVQPYDSGQPWYLNPANGLTATLLYFSYVPAFAGGFGLPLLSFAGAFWLLGWVLQFQLTALLWIISLPLRGLASLLSRRSLYKYLLGSSLAGTILAILLATELGCIQFRFRRGGYPEGQILIGSHL